MDKPLGTLQVDVDDLWVYYESIGRATPPDVAAAAFTQGVPRLLDLFDRYAARATFFVCGRDLPAQAEMVAEMTRRGHEVANHSAAHRNGYARLSRAELRADVLAAHERIAAAAGRPPAGFKAPGFSFNRHLPGVLAELGYRYDSSILPTFYAPLLRLLQRALSGGHVDPTHYGRWVYGFRPLRPFRLQVERLQVTGYGSQVADFAAGESSAAANLQPSTFEHSNLQPLWESPVTTMPLLRLPMHSTFVLSAGRWLFDAGLGLARTRGVPVNYLLHAGDVVDAVADPALASYRFLVQPWAERRPLYEHMLARLSDAYQLVPTQEFVCARP
ncbi:MAG: Peptidoglycan deacetylase [Chloroflexi bacterium ADurb.Bin325]|nr:MAG: Peptidoglycan deacetylase [Chloroflexi bacterium ADurb.Bin325]